MELASIIATMIPRRLQAVLKDRLRQLPGNRLWAIEIKRSLAPKVDKGFRVALADLDLDKAFLVYPGEERYPNGDGIEAIGLPALTEALSQAD